MNTTALCMTLLSLVTFAALGNADVILETATMATEEATTSLQVGRSLLEPDSLQFLGARFHLDLPANVTAVGGHFKYTPTEDTSIFGAIIALTGRDALPQGDPFTAEEILATTVFSNPYWGSQDLRAPLSVSLPPGDYALVFGSELFGATGCNSMATNNPELPGPSVIVWHDTNVWANHAPQGLRFVVEGEIIPEPGVVLVLAFGGACGLLSKTRRTHR